MQIIGFAPYSSEFNGKVYTGVTFYVSKPLTKEGCVGRMGDKFSLRDYRVAELFPLPLDEYIGEEVEVFFNRWGKVDYINFV